MNAHSVFFRTSWLAVLLALVSIAGCGSNPTKPPTGTPEPDKFLWDHGNDALGKKRWLVAREYYR